jgi:hypothetical protein
VVEIYDPNSPDQLYKPPVRISLAGRDRDPPRNVIPPIPAKFLLTPSPVHWDQSLDRRRLEFSGLFVTAGWLRRHDRARNRGLFPYRPIRALPTPTLHFSLASARLSRADLMGPPASSNGGCGLFAGNRAIIRSSTRAHAHASWGCDRPRCGAKTRAGGACWRVFGQSRSRQGAVPFPRWTIDRPGDRGRPGPHRGGGSPTGADECRARRRRGSPSSSAGGIELQDWTTNRRRSGPIADDLPAPMWARPGARQSRS